MAHGVALRLRALAATRWIDRSDVATVGALLAGAAEVERQAAALMATEARLTAALHACGDAARQRVEVRSAIAAAARYEGMYQRMAQPALATLRERDALRTALDGARAGDLAGLGRREAGEVRRWRGCHRCGRCFLLADTEAVPGHGVTVDGVDRDCGTKGEGR